MILTWRANELSQTTPIPDADIITLSRKMGALNGYDILTRNKWWRLNGMWGNKTWAFAAINPANQTETQTTVWEFGGADIGLNLPTAWRDDEIWDVGSGPAYRPGSWGGHSVPIVAYDDAYAYVITWGKIQAITYPAIAKYSDEAYAIIDPSWLAKGGETPSALDLPKLRADLTLITAA